MRRRLAILLAGLVIAAMVGVAVVVAINRLSHGTLSMRILHLPAGVAAAVTVSGPGGFRVLVTHDAELSVDAGTYQLRKQPVRSGSDAYYTTTATTSVTVTSANKTSATVDYDIIIPKSTRVLNLRAGGTVTVLANSLIGTGQVGRDLTTLQPGEVIVSGATPATPGGLIRRVVSVTASGGSTTVTTSPATLRDAIPRGRFHIRATITPSHSTTQTLALGNGFADSIQLAAAKSSDKADGLFTWKGGCQAGATADLNAYFHLQPFVDFEVDWGFFSPNTLALTVGFDQDAGASVNINVSASCDYKAETPSQTLGTIEFGIGPVPIVIKPQLSGTGYLSGNFTGGTTLGATEAFKPSVSAKYDHGNFSFNANATAQVNLLHTLLVCAAGKIGAGPTLALDVDNLGGPSATESVQLASQVDTTEAKVIGGVALSAAIHLGFLGFNIDHDFGEIVKPDTTLARWAFTSASSRPSPCTPPTAYVFTASAVIPINLVTNTPGTPIEMPGVPLAISPDGKTAYVGTGSWPDITGAGGVPGALVSIDLATGRAGTPIPVPAQTWPVAFTITPDGRSGYLITSNAPEAAGYGTGGDVVPIDLTTNTARAVIPIPAGTAPTAIAITPDGRTAYVTTNKPGGQIGVGPAAVVPINLVTQTAGTPIPISGGTTPIAIAITRDGRTAYVTNSSFTQNTPGGAMPVAVVPINLATNTSGSPMPFTSFVGAIAIAPDDQTAYVINEKYSGTDIVGGTYIGTFVVPINLKTDTPGNPISLTASDIAIAPDGRTAYVTQQGEFVVPINLRNLTRQPPIRLPAGAVAGHIVVIG